MNLRARATRVWLLCLVAKFVLPSPPRVVGATPPIGAFAFSEVAGRIAPDSSARQHHATVVSATLTVGRFGQGVDFNGRDAYLRIDRPDWPREDYTYAAWVFPRTVRGWHALVEIQTPAGTGVELALAPGGYVELWSSGALRLRTGAPVPAKSWTHVAVTRSGGLITAYTNAVAQRVGRDSTVFDFVNCPALIGVDADRGCAGRMNGFFDGLLDELQVYDRALSAVEIGLMMDVPVPPAS